MIAENLRTRIKKEILERVVRAFYDENPAEKVRLIPFEMKPHNAEDTVRCCVYHDRKVIESRTLASLGFSIEEEDERVLLSTYFEEAMKRTEPEETVLTVLESACRRCVPQRIYVTELCQGCLTQSCMESCKFDAIDQVHGRAIIDQVKCRNCGRCLTACPYTAIVKYHVPCEEICPVKAMVKDQHGHARIQFDKCISCGKCVHVCPFGAVHEKSQIIDILKNIKQQEKCVLLVAPSIMWQFQASIKQLRTAFMKAGFFDVFEVAEGADITTKNEAAEFKERIEEHNAPFMTTSCCAAYNELLDKHLEEMKPYVSETKTPLNYTAKIAKELYKDAKIIFASPCVAKRKEGQINPDIDYIISFEEAIAVLEALNIIPEDCEETDYRVVPSAEGRNFAVSSGVAKAVEKVFNETSGNNSVLKAYCINGLTKESIRELKTMAKTGKSENGNLIEVMSCQGGCVGGNSCLSRTRKIRTSPVK